MAYLQSLLCVSINMCTLVQAHLSAMDKMKNGMKLNYSTVDGVPLTGRYSAATLAGVSGLGVIIGISLYTPGSDENSRAASLTEGLILSSSIHIFPQRTQTTTPLL